jgi:hypothetical protein
MGRAPFGTNVRKQFFFEKKNQKTFVLRRRLWRRPGKPLAGLGSPTDDVAVQKFFARFFSKKRCCR